MKVWGCPAYVKQIMSNKLEAKSEKCLFVGYPKETIGYQFYNSLEQKVFVSKRIVFLNKNLNIKTEKILRNIRFNDKVDDSGSKSNSDSAIMDSYVCSSLNASSCDLSSLGDEKRVCMITQPSLAGSLTTSSEDSKQIPPSRAPSFPSIGETSFNWKD